MQNLISSGSFGCVYSPTILCNGHFSTSKSQKNKITKLQLVNFNSLNEDKIGKYIKSNIHNYPFLFGVLTMKCKQKKMIASQLHKTIKKECPILKSNTKTDTNDEVILLEGQKIKGTDIVEDMFVYHSKTIKNKNIKHYVSLSYFINTYSYLLNSIRILNQHKIIHMDLKNDNILVDSKKNIPIMIDFGISFFSNQVHNGILNEIFYVYAPEYILWCPEIHFLNYIIHEKKKIENNSKEEIINMFVDDIMYENTTIFKYIHDSMYQVDIHKAQSRTQSHDTDMKVFKSIYKKELIQFIREIFDKNIHLENPLKLYEKISYYTKTWDMYSVSLLFLKMFRHSKVYFDYETESTYTKEPLEIFNNKIMKCLSSDPRKRPKVEEVIYVMDIIYQNIR